MQRVLFINNKYPDLHDKIDLLPIMSKNEVPLGIGAND
jgi:hypothetical protein